MLWEEIRRLYPDQYVILQALSYRILENSF